MSEYNIICICSVNLIMAESICSDFTSLASFPEFYKCCRLFKLELRSLSHIIVWGIWSHWRRRLISGGNAPRSRLAYRQLNIKEEERRRGGGLE